VRAGDIYGNQVREQPRQAGETCSEVRAGGRRQVRPGSSAGEAGRRQAAGAPSRAPGESRNAVARRGPVARPVRGVRHSCAGAAV